VIECVATLLAWRLLLLLWLLTAQMLPAQLFLVVLL
jgi:hypothetical protein